MKDKSPLILIGILFFIFGFVTWLNSTLVPFLRIACELTHFESYLVTFAFYIAYVIFGLPSGKIIIRVGYSRSMTIGLSVMAVGAAFFVPAAYTRFYLFFLIGLFLMGAGLTLLQTAANPYAAVLGSPETAARRISLMGICNKFAGVLAPLILGTIVLGDTGYITSQIDTLAAGDPLRDALLTELSRRCILPYCFIVLFLFVLAGFVHFSPLPDLRPSEDFGSGAPAPSRIASPRFWLGVVALFFYVGVEVIGMDSLIGYAMSHGMEASSAKIFPSLSMVAFMVGYLIGIAGIPRLFSQKTALILSALASMAVMTVAILTPGIASVYVLVLLGLTHAMIWPAVWGIALEGLGKSISTGSSLLVMAVVGGALLPLLFGMLIDRVGHQAAYWMTLPCYAVILLYAVTVKRRLSD